jgi:hypothetical protein
MNENGIKHRNTDKDVTPHRFNRRSRVVLTHAFSL